MLFHHFKYTLKSLFKNKSLIFWTFAFPIILGTFFQMAFSDIEKNEMLDIMNIGIVTTEKWNSNEALQETFKTLGDLENEERLFQIVYGTKEQMQSLLEDSSIVGYLLVEEEPLVVVKENGMNETIFSYVTEEILQNQKMMQNKIETKLSSGTLNPLEMESFYENLYLEVEQMKEASYIEDISSENLHYTMIEFYTLIAMACLYGGILGMVVVHYHLANMSHKGKRVSVSPISKGKLIFSSLLASYLVQAISILLLFLYTIFVLGVDYGNHFWLILLLALVGCLAGLSLGIFISCCFKTSENTKTGILLAFTMLGCFFSGMMGITMKYVVDTHFPIVNLLNPASMITDGFYSLYYYDTFERYGFDLTCLFIFSFILLLISIVQLRRQTYDSI